MVHGRVIRSVLSPGVFVAPGAVVRDSVIFNDTVIEAGAVIDRTILDKDVRVGEGAVIGDGENNTPNRDNPTQLNTGLTLVGKGASIPAGASIGRNAVIRPGTRARQVGKQVESGTTV